MSERKNKMDTKHFHLTIDDMFGIIKLQMMLDTHYSPVHYVTVSTYVFDDKGYLTSIYEVNQKALLEYLKGI